MEVTYKNIEPIIVSADLTGDQLVVVFKARNQEKPTETSTTIQGKEKVVQNAVKGAAKSTATNGFISFFSRLLGNSIGGTAGSMTGSVAGSAGREVASKKMSSSSSKSVANPKLSAAEKEVAVVAAFKTVEHLYEYKEDEGAWVFK